GSTIEPVGRSFSLSQVICGTLNCSCAGSNATCCAVSFRNGSSLAMVAWSSDFGSVIWVAAEAASWPIVSRMACCCSARLGPEAPGDGLPVAAAAAGLVAAGVVAGGVVAAAVGLAPGEAVAPGDGLALPDGLVAVGRSVVVSSTFRKRIWAGLPTWAMSSSFWPGTDTMIVLLPSSTTVASATPNALTRFSMMSRAVSRLLLSMFWPGWALACSVSVVPPIRSRPSFGLNRLLNDPCPPMTTIPNRTKKIASNVNRYRDGRIWPWGGDATVVDSPCTSSRRCDRAPTPRGRVGGRRSAPLHSSTLAERDQARDIGTPWRVYQVWVLSDQSGPGE